MRAALGLASLGVAAVFSAMVFFEVRVSKVREFYLDSFAKRILIRFGRDCVRVWSRGSENPVSHQRFHYRSNPRENTSKESDLPNDFPSSVVFYISQNKCYFTNVKRRIIMNSSLFNKILFCLPFNVNIIEFGLKIQKCHRIKVPMSLIVP